MCCYNNEFQGCVRGRGRDDEEARRRRIEIRIRRKRRWGRWGQYGGSPRLKARAKKGGKRTDTARRTRGTYR